jgi:TonB family protein
VWAHVHRLTGAGILSCVLILTAGSPAQAQTPSPSEPSAKPSGNLICPISIRYYRLPGNDDVAVFGLWTDGAAGKATGSFVVYGSGRRYVFPFADAVAADDRNVRFPPTPIVLRFPPPFRFQGAYVNSLNGSPCPIHEPAVRSISATDIARVPKVQVYPDWRDAMRDFFAEAAAVTPADAPAGVPVDPPACKTPYADAYTKHAEKAETPYANGYAGYVVVKLEIGPDGKLTGMRIDKTSHSAAFDEAAAEAVRESTFAPQIFRCEPVSGDYLFYVNFVFF